METIVKADIFFFISSVATVIVTVLLSIVLFYLARAGRNLHQITQKLQEHFRDSEEFVLDLKERIEENIFFRLFFPPARSQRKSETKKRKKKAK
jgi:hypothetical protein